MGRSYYMVEIDGEKLNRLLKEKGLLKSDVSREVGMATNYISNSIGYGNIRLAIAKMMEMKYGIMIDDYKREEPAPVEEPETVEASEDVRESVQIDYGAIREAVREGVLDAISAALGDSDTRGAIYGLIASAQKGGMQLAWNEKLKGVK